MRIYIGVGATEAQELPFLVLKQTLLQYHPEHEFIIQNINDTEEYQHIDKQLEATYGTVFSLQRFIVPKIAKQYDADICMHLDSDMLCYGSLQPFLDLVYENKTKIVLPKPCSKYKQAQQTAVFGCVPSQWAIELFESNLKQFLEAKISYVDLMRLSFSSDRIIFSSHIYNSRELYEDDTVILHLTDLYRQPWVSRFNNLSALWHEKLKEAIVDNPSIRTIIKEGVEKQYYLPSMLKHIEPTSRGGLWRDILFLPPQFDAYAQQRFGKQYATKAAGALKVMITLWVQAIAIWHNLTNNRTI